METFELTKNQKQIFEAVENSNENFLIVGKPGVGKSVLIRELTTKGNKSYTLAAPTGLAALNIEGRTLHSIFRLPVSHGIIDPSFNRFPVEDRVVNFIKYQVRALIIDEISMVRADTFDYIDRFLKHVKENNKPFGGVQIIAIGDFYQLPPVIVRDEVPQLKNAGYTSGFVFSSYAFQGNFKILALNEVLRQKNDPDFVDLLDSARDGSVKPAQVAKLNKQVGNPNDIRINLTARNVDADNINSKELQKINEEEFLFQAYKYGEWPALPAEENLYLKVGAQVMVKMNSADRPPKYRGRFDSRVVNGTLGKVVKIIFVGDGQEGNEGDETNVDRVIIELENSERVTIYRKRWERKIKEKVGDEWDERVVASFEQIPLALAWAISIHKSQGQSFDKCHIDASRIFAPGQMYVALSRCRSLAGISLQAPITTSKIWANRDVINFFDSIEIEA